MINDKYTANRGGFGQTAKLYCDGCGEFLSDYQKDGAIGPLKRIYVDRIMDKEIVSSFAVDRKLCCKKCGLMLGLGYFYEKENRPAYRIFQNAVNIKYSSKLRYLVCWVRGLLLKV